MKHSNKYYCKSCGRMLPLVFTEMTYCYHCGRYQYNINYKSPSQIKCNSARKRCPEQGSMWPWRAYAEERKIMSWRAGITTKRKYRTGYSLHDEVYCTYGKITSKEEAMKRVASAWKKKIDKNTVLKKALELECDNAFEGCQPEMICNFKEDGYGVDNENICMKCRFNFIIKKAEEELRKAN